MIRLIAQLAVVIWCMTALPGCAAFKFISAVAQADEDQKLIEVLPKYSGLENKRVAVLVDADMATLYEHPTVVDTISNSVYGRIQSKVPGVIVVPSHIIRNWQYRTPQWSTLPFDELAEQLNVDRVVHINILEYRLNPPGNRYLWDGACIGRVGIIERAGIDPDSYVATFDIASAYPNMSGVGRESATESQIETGVLYQFVEKAAWLFYTHEEPKHPDRYRPELDRPSKKKA